MSDIFREVEEEVRRDKAAEIWKKYGKLFILAAVLLVAGTAGWSAWQQYQRKQAELAVEVVFRREAGFQERMVHRSRSNVISQV